MNDVHPMDVESNRKRPKDTPFRQQTMRAYKPVPTVKCAVMIFIVLGLVFIAVGSVIYSFSQDIVEKRERYDNVSPCDSTEWDQPQECQVQVTMSEDIDETVFFYYELHNYYQNHRRYVKSKSQAQLMGESLSKDEVESDCDPVVNYKELGNTRVDYSKVEFSDVANPCGLIAKTLFNDTFAVVDSAGVSRTIVSEGIAWDSDKDKFEKSDEYQWTDVEDEHFIVWMRTSGLPNFRKLWGKLDKLEKGTYTVKIKSNYNVKDFDGEKYVVLSTANKLGGKNDFLGIAYIVVGALTIALAIAFAVRGYFCKRPHDLQS